MCIFLYQDDDSIIVGLRTGKLFLKKITYSEYQLPVTGTYQQYYRYFGLTRKLWFQRTSQASFIKALNCKVLLNQIIAI
jgi:hypothetical protein